MTSFLLRFQERVGPTDLADTTAKTATATRTRESPDQDRGRAILAAKTKTVTAVQREGPDQDASHSRYSVFSRGPTLSERAVNLDAAKTATKTSTRESADQDSPQRRLTVLR